ncbi:hypothetical protein BCV69DRAFT_284289 [Microstroma glucosiphilum]|uniref:Nicotinamide-nucleotide adenylyltransferase n=1 Tax=Pseudomicrostroma glucosiphilum TaxID=1684307 RepID=A0A316U3T2_9BASI|nr:hypothetical protein BCV69DRAFT_284289 [Pseudomicrostroma glucosiphilum]PWN19131.1 hypothetical protein BCV69DRAFT_284289 [Pseudomicrostroma glucosiphilum]
MSTIPASVRSQIASRLEAFARCTQQPKPVHLIYSTRNSWPYLNNYDSTSTGDKSGMAESSRSADPTPDQDLDIAVLDSSFNPPHLAHLSLVSSSPFLSRSAPPSSSRKHYDAHLLLLSSKNADKGSGKAGDASPEQRLSMMYLLAKDLERKLSSEGSKEPNVAVVVVEEPLMKDKSTLLHSFFKEQTEGGRGQSNGAGLVHRARPRLHWVVGWDTIIRYFALKYYPSPESFARSCDLFFNQEGTTFVAARRVVGGSAPDRSDDAEQSAASLRKEEDKFLGSDLVRPWVEKGSVTMFDLPKEARGVSSTLVRSILLEDGVSGKEKLRKLRQGDTVSEDLAKYLVEEDVYKKTA